MVQGDMVLAKGVWLRTLYKLDVVSQVRGSGNVVPKKRINQWKHWRHQIWFSNIVEWGILVKRNYKGCAPRKLSMELIIWRIEIVFCEECFLRKKKRVQFSLSNKKVQEVLELVHSNICEPMDMVSIGGSCYFITFSDDFSWNTCVYFISKKNDALEVFNTFVSLVERKSGNKVKDLRSHNCGEYSSNIFEIFLKISKYLKA
jgi:hypothetical protein